MMWRISQMKRMKMLTLVAFCLAVFGITAMEAHSADIGVCFCMARAVPRIRRRLKALSEQ